MSVKFEADWSGWTTVIVGTGPSSAVLPLFLARGICRVVVVKSTWRFAPWADVLYGLDKEWWIANSGARNFHGLKVTAAPSAAKAFSLQQVKLKSGARIILEPKWTLGCGLAHGGGHSGWQAINLAVQFGSRSIVLVGFEMHGGRFNEHEPGVAKIDAKRTRSWRDEMDAARPEFDRIGCRIVNATPMSELKNYEYVQFEDAILWQ